MQLSRFTIVIVAIATIILTFIATVGAGELNPTAAPSDTFTEISARARVIDSLPYTINTAGHYYLRDSLVAGLGVTSGITINVSNVTIDLNGAILGGGASGLTGIFASDESNITVRNGVVAGWNDYGIRLNRCDSCVLEDLRVWSNGNVANAGSLSAIVIDDSGIIRRCVVNTNDSDGIRAGDGCVITECTSSDNLDTGIIAGDSCVISRCVIDGNARDDTEDGGGIVIGSTSLVESCTVTNNHGSSAFNGNGIVIGDSGVVRGCTVTGNDLIGIATMTGNRVEDCISSDNGAGGIMGIFLGFTMQCQFINNVCCNNATYGIIGSGQCHIQGNLCVGNDYGIDSSLGDNLVVGNACLDNTTADYNGGDGTAQQFDPGTNFTNTTVPLPWANFEN